MASDRGYDRFVGETDRPKSRNVIAEYFSSRRFSAGWAMMCVTAASDFKTDAESRILSNRSECG